MKTQTILILLLLFFPVISGYSQFVKKEVILLDTSLKSGQQSYKFKSDELITSVSVRIAMESNFNNASLIANGRTYKLTKNEEVDAVEFKTSNLIIFDVPVKTFTINPDYINGKIEVFMINDKNGVEYPSVRVKMKKKSACGEEPPMIDQSEWRKGLDEPSFDRIHHDVNNIIIHHSATSNTISDYTSAVRNIYIYHTVTNGWSDIGYNYVIVPNGDIYKGRDPALYPQDEVMGAHFCGKNSETMGICMLGTYVTDTPTDTALASLELLLAWKLVKDSLMPMGMHSHPLNPYLNVIAGHRDGCATQCPGDILYGKLDKVRDNIYQQFNICGFSHLNLMNTHLEDITIYPNPVSNILHINSPIEIDEISITDLSGRLVRSVDSPGNYIDFSGVKTGLYLIKLKSGEQSVVKKVCRIN